MLTLKNITASVGDTSILNSLSYTFEKGKTYALMGPNGSGKSTLASVVMGNPTYSLSSDSHIMFEDEDITDSESYKRAQKGLFLSYQTPVSLSGVTIYQLLRYALHGTRDPLAIRQAVQKYARELHIHEDLLSRSLNEDFSGGEKKKMEILQACVMQPKVLFFDEIDTGVDVDALKTIGSAMKKLKSSENTFIIITHYTRILKYIKPDVVLVLKDGRIHAEGDMRLAQSIEKKGYDSIQNSTV